MTDSPDTAPDDAGDDHPTSEEAGALSTTGADAAREALARAREAALKSGYRPGQKARPGDGGYRSARRRASAAEPEYSGPGPDQRDPQSIGASLDELAEQQKWNRSLSIGTVIAAWPNIVGAEVAAHTTPEKVEDEELVVRADSTAWATQLRLLTTAITSRLDEVVGDGQITKVRVLGPSAPTWKKGPRSVPGRGPRDTYG